MSLQAKYIGDPTDADEQNRLPETVTILGVEFPRGKFVDVPDQMAAKFKGHSHFETKGKEPEATQELTLTSDTATGEVTARPAGRARG